MKAATPFDNPGMTDLDHWVDSGTGDAGVDGRVLVDELMPRYLGAVGRRAVADAIQAAICDLRGSICSEALPEMATRLAMFRLDEGVSRTTAEPRNISQIGVDRPCNGASEADRRSPESLK